MTQPRKLRPQSDLYALIAGNMAKYDISVPELASALGMSRSTWYRIRDGLGKLSIDDLSTIHKLLHIDQAALFAAIKL